MTNKLFNSLLEGKGKTKKWLFLPFSFIMHALLIFSLTIGPLLDANNQMPQYRIIDGIQFADIPLPPIPQGKRGGGSGKKSGPKGDGPKNVQPATVSRFVAPIEVAEKLEEEEMFGEFMGLENGPGVEGNPYGEDVGIEGMEYIPGINTQIDAGLKPVRIQSARLIRRVKPVYPPIALKARIEGIVIVEAVTNIYGKVVQVNLRKGHPLLNPAAVDAVRKWVYEPYVIGGIPKPVVFTVTVTFRLQQR